MSKKQALKKRGKQARIKKWAQTTARESWEAQDFRLRRALEKVKRNESGQPPKWVEGQVRYFAGLLEAHQAKKPGR